MTGSFRAKQKVRKDLNKFNLQKPYPRKIPWKKTYERLAKKGITLYTMNIVKKLTISNRACYSKFKILKNHKIFSIQYYRKANIM